MKIYISSCTEFKRGKKKDGTDWVLYYVKDPKNVQYSTFEEKYAAMVGQEVEVEIEEKPSDKVNPNTGKPYINRNILEAGKKKGGNDKEQLDRIERKVDEILASMFAPEKESSVKF